MEEFIVMIGIDFGTTNSAVAMADEFGHVHTARYVMTKVIASNLRLS